MPYKALPCSFHSCQLYRNHCQLFSPVTPFLSNTSPATCCQIVSDQPRSLHRLSSLRLNKHDIPISGLYYNNALDLSLSAYGPCFTLSVILTLWCMTPGSFSGSCLWLPLESFERPVFFFKL